MQTTSTLRTPYHSRVIVPSSATGPIDEGKLHEGIVLTQLGLLALCAARVATDSARGPLGVEGVIALALLVVLAASLIAKGADRAIHTPGG